VEILGLLAAAIAISALTVMHVRGFHALPIEFFDNGPYTSDAALILRWTREVPHLDQHFLGLPLAIAAASKVTGLSLTSSLVLLSLIASFVATALVYRMYGGKVAAVFAVFSIEWVEFSVFGGS